MENKLDFVEIVNELNLMIFEKDENNYEAAFFYTTDGIVDVITFHDKVLWSSEDEDREWIEEIQDYEPLKLFLLKRLDAYVCKITSIFKDKSSIN